MMKIESRTDVLKINLNSTKPKSAVKSQKKNVLQESNKVNKKITAKKGCKSSLRINESVKLNTEEMRDKISRLATSGEDHKGLRYMTFKEFEACETINKEILNMINKSKKIVLVTGAGISCNAGIPDFRSDSGLYNKKIRERDSKKIIRGKEMFDISVYRSLETIQVFNDFIFELYRQVLNSAPTRTHEFIKKLQEKNKLLKCYTQNIDGLERNCGLRTEFDCKEWNDTNVIQLHGDLHQLCCNSCKFNYTWDEIYDEKGDSRVKRRDIQDLPLGEEEVDEESGETDDDLMILSQNTCTSVSSTFSNGRDFSESSSVCSITESGPRSREEESNLIECPRCISKYEEKFKLGKRCLESSIGVIRPNIVLYGEEHPFSENFAKNINKDLNRKPNILLIFGTSLKVAGVKNLVKKMSKKIHENEKGLVIMVNKEPVSYSGWKNYIDYQIVSDCDAFCQFVEAKLPNLFG